MGALVFVYLAPQLTQAVGQSGGIIVTQEGEIQLPSGWESATVDEFSTLLCEAFDHRDQSDARITDSHFSEITKHMWAFLDDPGIVSGGDRASIRNLAWHFASGGPYVDQRAATLQDRLAARFTSRYPLSTCTSVELIENLQTLEHLGAEKMQLASTVADWVKLHGLSQLTSSERARLLQLAQAPEPDLNEMSAIFSGTLEVPTAGEFTFSRLNAIPHGSDWMKVWIDGNVVMDTFADLNSQGGSVPVTLARGSHAIRVDFARNVSENEYSNPFEIILLWEGPGIERQVVPAASLMQPSNSGPGLQAEYFAGSDFGSLIKVTTIDELGYASGSFCESQQSLVDTLRASLMSAADWTGFVQEPEWPTRSGMAAMTVTERGVLIDEMCSNHQALIGSLHVVHDLPRLLSLASSVSGNQMSEIGALWANEQARFETQIGEFPNWNLNGYLKLNEDGYALAGVQLGKAGQWENVEHLRDTALATSSGGCNLHVFKLVLHAHKWNLLHHPNELIAFIEDRLEDPSLAGDAKAEWLVARALCEEVRNVDRTGNPLGGARFLNLAFAEASTDETRFWVLREHATRLASLGRADEVASLVNGPGQSFTSAEQIEDMQYWARMANRFAKTDQYDRDTRELSQLDVHIDELGRRLQHAQSNGIASQIERLELMIETANLERDKLALALGK